MDKNIKAFRILKNIEHTHDISPDDKVFLSECKEINWSFSTAISSIPKYIGLLENLETFDLTGIGLVSLPDEICNLQSLHTLVLRDNKLTKLPDKFVNLTSLKTLDLSRNAWEVFPEQIKELPLTYLNISYCSFPHLPELLLDFNLEFLFSESGHGIIMERTIAPEMAVFSKPRTTIIKYYTSLREQGLIVREAKVVLLGDGDAGKTYTVDRIKNGKKLDKHHIPDQTKGISIAHKDFTYKDNVVTINFWDFGGQQILHAMHRCFLTGNTLYVIVLSGRAEVMERRLHYWMTTINSFVAEDVPVVVLENLFEIKNETHLDATKMRRRYQNIVGIYHINVKNASDEDFDCFVNKLLEEAVLHTRYGASVPKHWADVKRELEKSELPFLSKAEFTKELSKVSPKTVNDELEILDWLNELGTSFSCHRVRNRILLHEYVVLNPEWATNAIYAIITNSHLSPASNGIISLTEIEHILHNTTFVNQGKYDSCFYSPSNIAYILELMENYLISFRIKDISLDYEKEFIPSLCANSEPDCVKEYIKNADIHYEIHYSYLPSNLLHRFMIENYSKLLKCQTWWYNGGIFSSDDAEYGCSALVMREIVHNEDDRIAIYIHSLRGNNNDNSWRYLEQIRKGIEIFALKMNIKATGHYVYYSEPNSSLSERIKLETIRKHIELGWTTYQSTILEKAIPVAEILKNLTPISDVASHKSLLPIIIASCSCLQKRQWIPPDEPKRNDYLCDLFRSAQVLVLDQSRSGTAKTDAGELDFLFQDSKLRDYALMEAMILNSLKRSYVQEHITKLVDDKRYNPNGLKELYLLTYADVERFQEFCARYYDFVLTATYPADIKSTEKIEIERQRNIAVWKFELTDGTVLHHIVVKTKLNNES